MPANTPYLLNLANADAPRFAPVDDRVMGGRSASRFRLTPERTGIFEGVVSLENNGGFASVRASLENRDMSSVDGLLLRARGDGQRYRLTLRNDRKLSGLNYQHSFDTEGGRWEDIPLLFRDFVPSIRGYRPMDAPPLDPRRIRQVGLMISDGHQGPFRLELAWIRGLGAGG